MAVAYDAFSNNGGTSGAGTFSWTHTPAGTPRGVVLLITNIVDDVNNVTGVTYGGVAMTQVSGGVAFDTAGEAGMCAAWFLGSSIPTGAQTVQVTAGADTYHVCAMSFTAAANTEATGVVLLQEDGTLAEQSVTDGSTGIDSVRVAGIFSGLASPPSAGASSTLVYENDDGLLGVSFVRETTAGQGSRSVGFSSGSTDDRAAVHLAVREVVSVPVPEYPPASEGDPFAFMPQPRRRNTTVGRGGHLVEWFEPLYSEPETVTADKFASEFPAVMRKKRWRPSAEYALTDVPVPADVVEHGWEFDIQQLQLRYRRHRNSHLYGMFETPQLQDPLTTSYLTILGTMTIRPAYFGVSEIIPTYEGEGGFNIEGE